MLTSDFSLSPGLPSSLRPLALVAIAEQYADREQLDIAVIILYRAFDLFCLEETNLRSIPDVWEHPPETVPESVITFWHSMRSAFGLPERSGTFRVGYADRVFILAAYGVLPDSKDQLRSILMALDIRNQCWLAHGDRFVSSDQWEWMLHVLGPLIRKR